MTQGIQYRPIPPTYDGQPWTNKLLHQMSAPELKKVLALYGHEQVNAAVANARAQGGSQ